MKRPDSLLFLAPGDVRKARVEPISWMKTCAAFADQGIDVTLVTLRIRMPDAVPRDAIWGHFGVAPVFSVWMLPSALTQSSSKAAFRLWAGVLATAIAVGVMLRATLTGHRPLIYARSLVMMAPVDALRRFVPRSRRPALVFETHVLPVRSNWGLVRRADLVVANSQRLRDDLVSELDLPAERVVCAPLPPYAQIEPTDRVTARSELGLKQDASIICYAGKMFEELNELLLRTGAVLRDRRPPVQLMLVGGNPEILRWTRERITAEGLDGWLTLAGFVPPHQVGVYMSAADVLLFVMLPSQEHFEYCTPAKGLDYQAVGRPIVALDIPLFDEVFGRDGERAIKIARPEPSLLADGIEAALSLGREGQAMSARAQRFAGSRSWEHRVSHVMKSLAELG